MLSDISFIDLFEVTTPTKPDTTPAPESDGDGEPVPAEGTWYVEVGEQQVGPLRTHELSELWEREGLDSDTLMWRPGLDDWTPLVELRELGELDLHLAAAPGASGETASPGSASSLSVRARREPIDWQASTAAALSSLVADELHDPHPRHAPAPSSRVTAPPPGLLFPSFEPFGGPAAASPGLLPPIDPWRVPAPPRAPARRFPWALTAVMFVSVATLATASAVFVRTQSVAAAVAPPPAARALAETHPTPPGDGRAAIRATLDDRTSSVAPSGKADTASSDAPSGSDRQPATSNDEERKRKRQNDHPSKDAGRKSRPATADVPAQPKLQDVLATVKASAGSVAPCIRSARDAAELLPGKHTLTLEWIIRPDGSVQAPQVTGPSHLLATRLPGCVARAMKSWRFPPSRKGAPVKRYPFGPFTVR